MKRKRNKVLMTVESLMCLIFSLGVGFWAVSDTFRENSRQNLRLQLIEKNAELYGSFLSLMRQLEERKPNNVDIQEWETIMQILKEEPIAHPLRGSGRDREMYSISEHTERNESLGKTNEFLKVKLKSDSMDKSCLYSLRNQILRDYDDKQLNPKESSSLIPAHFSMPDCEREFIRHVDSMFKAE